MFLFPMLSTETLALLPSKLVADINEPANLNTPRLPSLDNFGDVAGTHKAYLTPHGTMRGGVFYRCNAVTPSPKDLATLEDLGIRAVFDLRAPADVEETPDTVPSGAEYRRFDILASLALDINRSDFPLDNATQAIEMMKHCNRTFVRDAVARNELGALLEQMAAIQGPVLFHCTAGKDRTGWVAALLQSIAGVDEVTIMEGYLATNTYTAEDAARIYAPLLRVDASYIQAGLDEVKTRYTDIEGYLTQGLKLSPSTINGLRS